MDTTDYNDCLFCYPYCGANATENITLLRTLAGPGDTGLANNNYSSLNNFTSVKAEKGRHYALSQR